MLSTQHFRGVLEREGETARSALHPHGAVVQTNFQECVLGESTGSSKQENIALAQCQDTFRIVVRVLDTKLARGSNAESDDKMIRRVVVFVYVAVSLKSARSRGHVEE